ncbi:IclR family transcriptional regulator C-terminal domain-containing protein [Microbacterium sp.]|uniref:IclR family transcriptional regulator n=1 Tax=Microbacterium sp. TaxID=51671 RepID=UPI003221DDBC
MVDDGDDRAGRDPAPAVTRAIRLLGLLADARHPLTLTEIASELALAKSSTANLCLALESARMIERVAAGYRLGMRTAELGGAFASQFTQIRELYTVCEASPVLADELVQMAILDGCDTLYLARYEGAHSARLGAPLGSRLPAALTGAGRALLMRLDDAEVTALLADAAPFPALTEHSTRDLDGLLARLDAARARGWALDEEESTVGIVGVAVAVEGWAPGDPRFGLGVGIPVGEAVPERIARVGAALQQAAHALTNPFSSAVAEAR